MAPKLAKPTQPAEASTPVRPTYVIDGPERYLKAQAVENVRRAVLGNDPDPVACSVHAANAALADVLDDLRTLPLLSAHRLVIVEDSDVFIRQHREALERYCAQPSPSASLVLICKTFSKTYRLYKVVQRLGLIISCDSPKGDEIASWMVRHVRAKYCKQMDPRTAGALRRLAGDDLATLDNELAKLTIYVADRPVITAGDVDNLVGCHREEKVFGIAEALARRDSAGALALWEQAWLTERAAPMRAAGGLAWSLRRNLESKIFLQEGGSPEVLQRKFWKRPEDVGRLSLEDFEEQLIALGRAERSVLGGVSRSLQVAIEKMIVSVCTRFGVG